MSPITRPVSSLHFPFLSFPSLVSTVVRQPMQSRDRYRPSPAIEKAHLSSVASMQDLVSLLLPSRWDKDKKCEREESPKGCKHMPMSKSNYVDGPTPSTIGNLNGQAQFHPPLFAAWLNCNLPPFNTEYLVTSNPNVYPWSAAHAPSLCTLAGEGGLWSCWCCRCSLSPQVASPLLRIRLEGPIIIQILLPLNLMIARPFPSPAVPFHVAHLVSAGIAIALTKDRLGPTQSLDKGTKCLSLKHLSGQYSVRSTRSTNTN